MLMYSILIVDDDVIIRDDICNLVDWGNYGYKIAGAAGNGLEALRIMKETHVDIVVTDIYMPLMNGIDLIKESRAINNKAKFIVISNYDDFEYVKDALKLGASDYILKYEVEKERLLSLLDVIKNQIEEENRKRIFDEISEAILIERFWANVLNGSSVNQELPGLPVHISGSLENGSYVIILLEIYKNDPQMKFLRRIDESDKKLVPVSGLKEIFSFPCSLIQFDEGFAIIVQTSKKSFSEIRHQIMDMCNKAIGLLKTEGFYANITTGNMGIVAEDAANEFSLLKKASKIQFYLGVNKVIDAVNVRDMSHDIDYTEMVRYQAEIIDAITNDEKDSALCCIKNLFSYIRQNYYSPDLLNDFFTSLYYDISKTVYGNGLDSELIFGQKNIQYQYEKFRNFVIIEDIENYFINVINNIFNFKSVAFSDTKRPEIIKALEYINRHYMNNITLNDVASYVGFSRNYFCRIFKEETGENFVEYLNRFRVEKAKRLLRSSNCNVLEVAAKVGMQDYRYFCKVFKTLTGYKPSAFKKHIYKAE